eukprot:4103155-Pleurochrysis_carterae.AAC.1
MLKAAFESDEARRSEGQVLVSHVSLQCACNCANVRVRHARRTSVLATQMFHISYAHTSTHARRCTLRTQMPTGWPGTHARTRSHTSAHTDAAGARAERHTSSSCSMYTGLRVHKNPSCCSEARSCWRNAECAVQM